MPETDTATSQKDRTLILTTIIGSITAVVIALIGYLGTRGGDSDDSPEASATSVPSERYSKSVVIHSIDNTGYFDIDGAIAYPGDEDADASTADISVNQEQVAAQGFTKIALSGSGGKDTCLQAIATAPAESFSLDQVRNEKGFCVESEKRLVAYIEYGDLIERSSDHDIQLLVTAYNW